MLCDAVFRPSPGRGTGPSKQRADRAQMPESLLTRSPEDTMGLEAFLESFIRSAQVEMARLERPRE